MQYNQSKSNSRNYPNVPAQGHSNNISNPYSYFNKNNKSSSFLPNDPNANNWLVQSKFLSSNQFGLVKQNSMDQNYQANSNNETYLTNSYDLQYMNKNSQQFTKQKDSSSMMNSVIFQNKLKESNQISNYRPYNNNSVRQKRLPRVSQPLINQTQTTHHDKSYESFFKKYANPKPTSPNLCQSVEIAINHSIQIQKTQPQNQKKIYNKRSSIEALYLNKRFPKIQQKEKPQKNTHFTIQDFQIIKQLGIGKYGRVRLAKQKQSNFICALKQIQKKLVKEQEIVEQLIRQIKIQSYLNHPNIIKLFGFFQDQFSIYIIMEVAMGGQLFQQLKRSQPLSENKVAYYIRQVCEAIKELHSFRVIHRDIKPENIVLHENVIKICDFGWSVRQQTTMRTTFCGTPLYVCPQILKGNEYDQKIDIWSLGIMIYEMIIGENPFKITKEEELIKIIKDHIKIPSYAKISKQAQDLIYLCLHKNPIERADIRTIAEHDFFKKYPDKQAEKNKLSTF